MDKTATKHLQKGSKILDPPLHAHRDQIAIWVPGLAPPILHVSSSTQLFTLVCLATSPKNRTQQTSTRQLWCTPHRATLLIPCAPCLLRGRSLTLCTICICFLTLFSTLPTIRALSSRFRCRSCSVGTRRSCPRGNASVLTWKAL